MDSYLDSIIKNIPNNIKDLNIWLCYDDRDKPSYTQYDSKRIDRLKKQPRDLRGIPLKEWSSKRLYTFNECIKSIKNGFNSGVGVVVDNDLVGLDLDNCIKGYKKIDKLGLEIPIFTDAVAELVGKLNDSYIEISQSGNGLHCLLYSSVAIAKDIKNDNISLEIYSNKSHFLRLSGNVIINDAFSDIEILDKTDVMLEIYSKYFNIEDSKKVNDKVYKDSCISFRDDDFKRQFNGLTNKKDEMQILDNMFRIGGIFYYKLYNNELTADDIDKYNASRKGRGLKDTSNSGLSVLLILNLMYYSYGDLDIVYSLFRKSKLYKSDYEVISWRAKNLTKLDMIVNYCKSRFRNFKISVDLDLYNE